MSKKYIAALVAACALGIAQNMGFINLPSVAWSWGWAPILFLGPVVLKVFSDNQFDKELTANAKFATPDDHQVRWHISHNRQDVILLHHTVWCGFAIVIWILVGIANKLHIYD